MYVPRGVLVGSVVPRRMRWPTRSDRALLLSVDTETFDLETEMTRFTDGVRRPDGAAKTWMPLTWTLRY
jgi:hypothetical protein